MNPALEAGMWGLLAASALVVGAVGAFLLDLPIRVRGLIQAFGAGVLIGAIAYELVAEAVDASATGVDVAIGLGLGAVAFYLGSVAIGRINGEADDRPPQGARSPDTSGARLKSRRGVRAAGLAISLGTILDGLPESVVLGASLVPGAGVATPILVAVFVSNTPESLAATEDLIDGGWSRRRILGLWIVVAAASALAAAAGYAVLGNVGSVGLVLADAFAAGALIAMLAESMIPEAYETGGRLVGLATTLGFAVAAFLSFSS
jgi:ZIP family zinc transporter